MSYPNHPPASPFSPPLPPFPTNNFSSQNSVHNDDVDSNPNFDHSQSQKRPFSSINSNPTSNPPVNRGPPNLPVNRTGYMFYKTRLCLKFRDGNCPNGDQCTFAHGSNELREPPSNWQEIVGRKENSIDDQRSIRRFKICKKYANGEECPYGTNCNFLHKRGMASFESDMDGPRESSAICIGTSGHVMENRSVPNQTEVMTSTYWKTRVCTKWEITGDCPFGERCHFAHGQADLKQPGAQSEAEAVNIFPSVSPATMPVFIPTTATTDVAAAPATLATGNVVKKLYQKWKGPMKINGIYGDWLDGMEPPVWDPKNFES